MLCRIIVFCPKVYTFTSVYADPGVRGPRSYAVFLRKNSMKHSNNLGLRGYLEDTRFSKKAGKIHGKFTQPYLKTAYPRGIRVDRGYCYAIYRS